MDPDLMGPPCVQLQPEQIHHREPRHHRGVGPGLTALRGNTHALPVALAPGDRRLDAQRTGVQMAPYQRRIGPMDPARSDGSAELAVSKVGLGDDHQTRGVPVEAMDDSRPTLGAAGQSSAASDQRIDKGVVPVAGGGVNYQAGRLVDDGQVLVFENEREGDSGRLERSRWFVVRDMNRYDLSAGEESGGTSDFSIDGNPLIGNQTRSLGPRDRHLVGEEPVEALGFQTDNREFDLGSRLRLRQPEPTPPPLGGRPPARARWRVRWRRS